MYACAPLTSCVPMIAPKSSLGKQITDEKVLIMEELIIEAVNEMEYTAFTEFSDVIELYSPDDLIDIWLKYEGITGYSNMIKSLYELFYILIPKD